MSTTDNFRWPAGSPFLTSIRLDPGRALRERLSHLATLVLKSIVGISIFFRRE